MSEVIGRFVDAGAAAVRLDAIAFVWKDPATSSVNQAGTHEVVRALRADIDRRRPGVLVVTETNLPHDQNVSYLAPGEADAVYQFPLPPLVAHAFVAEDAGALVRWLQALTFPSRPPPTSTCSPRTTASACVAPRAGSTMSASNVCSTPRPPPVEW